MVSSRSEVATASGAKYIQQLCKHWSHKLPVEQDGNQGTVRFPNAVTRMSATPEALTVEVEAPDAQTVEQMQDVVARHLDRFAFREAPLPFSWSPVA